LFLTASIRYNHDVVIADRNSDPVTGGDRRGTGHPGPAPRPLTELRNEFASVRIALDERGNGPRLLVQDLESGAEILLSPLELASLCLATPDDRLDWLRVGHYRDERDR
jgi:hypothetical protein